MASIAMLPAPRKVEWTWQEVNEHSLSESLGLPEFQVKAMAVRDETVHLRCEHTRTTAECPDCGQMSGHLHAQTEREVRDVEMSGKRVLLHVPRRRFRCGSCQRVFTEQGQSVGPWRRYTRRYEQAVYIQCCHCPRKQVAQQAGLGEATVLEIFVREAEHVLAQAPPSPVRRLGMDEIALKKRHQQYALVLTDLDQQQVVDILPERKKEVIETWVDTWDEAQHAALDVVSTDLWEPFRQAIRSRLPQARQVADRFHVMRQLNRRLNQARTALARQADADQRRLLKGTRWALVKHPDSLTETETHTLRQALAGCPALRDLYLLKEEFRTICAKVKSRAQAARFLQAWCCKVQATGNPAFLKFLKCLTLWWHEFLNYFIDHTTQAFPEGIHNAMRVVMRRAYGFRNFRYFRLHILALYGPTS